jgi:hypothetical protein
MSAAQVSTGQRGSVDLITKSHGPLRAGLVRSWEPAPDIAQKSLGEIGTVGHVTVFNIDNGVAGKLSYAEKNAREIEAGMMNMEVSPGSSPEAIQMDHTRMERFSLLIRQKPEHDDVVFAAKYVYGCLAAPPASPVVVDDAMMREMSFRALRIVEIKGMDIRHARVRTAPVTGPLSTPAVPTLLEAAGGTLTTGDVVYVRTAMINAVVTAPTVPDLTTPLTRASAEVAEPIGVASRKVTVTVSAVPAGQTLAIYVGRFSGGETFYGYIAAAGTTIDITDYPDPTNPTPPRSNTTAAFQTVEDLIFGGTNEGFGNSVDLTFLGGKPARTIIPSGLKYMACLKNGILTPFSGDRSSEFLFSSTGNTFALNAAPTDRDVWDLFFPVNP